MIGGASRKIVQFVKCTPTPNPEGKPQRQTPSPPLAWHPPSSAPLPQLRTGSLRFALAVSISRQTSSRESAITSGTRAFKMQNFKRGTRAPCRKRPIARSCVLKATENGAASAQRPTQRARSKGSKTTRGRARGATMRAWRVCCAGARLHGAVGEAGPFRPQITRCRRPQ